MEEHYHFSHPHSLSFDQTTEDAQLTCTGCNLPCTNTAVYSCRACEFFLHDQCFNATRSLIHPSHRDHPLSLFPSPTYTSRSFVCKLCGKTGSGLCFCCSACEFDLHIHCAYNDRPKPSQTDPPPNQIKLESHPPNQIKLKSHPNHPLYYLQPYSTSHHSCFCDVCGTSCHPNGDLYRCDICDYDAHVECTRLPETVRRADNKHVLSLLYVNPYEAFECDVCRGTINQNNCMYTCTRGCDYGIHVKCVSRKKVHIRETFSLDMFPARYWVLALATIVAIIAIIGAMNNRGSYGSRSSRNYRY